MKRKYIRQNKNSFSIVRANRTYAKLDDLDITLFLRDLLVENDWNLDSLNETYEYDGQYIVLAIIDDRIHVLAKSKEKPSQSQISSLTDTFIIKKQIAGDDYVFGYYDKLEDAEFARNHLMDNMWDVNYFSQIQYDEDNKNYRVTEVIDDKVYVLGSFESRNDIGLDKIHAEFLNKIIKHKLGLAEHPYLDELTDRIPELEERFATKAQDGMWEFKNTQDPLNDIIFNLTPFQKSVYDVVDDSTVEDIEKALIRFRSGNFTQKIQKNLDELIEKGLICKNQNHYIKQKPK